MSVLEAFVASSFNTLLPCETLRKALLAAVGACYFCYVLSARVSPPHTSAEDNQGGVRNPT